MVRICRHCLRLAPGRIRSDRHEGIRPELARRAEFVIEVGEARGCLIWFSQDGFNITPMFRNQFFQQGYAVSEPRVAEN